MANAARGGFAPTVLVALLATSGAAAAEEEDGVHLSGFLILGAGFDTGRSGVGVLRDAEIHVNIRRTLAPGYALSGRIELEGWTSSSPDQIDEAYAILESPIGDFKIGGDDSAKSRYLKGVLYSRSGYHGYFDNGTFVDIDAKGGTTGGGDPVGIYYDSPDLNGLRFGFSYHPDRTSDNLPDASEGRAGDSNNVVFERESQYAAGFAYDGRVGDVELGIAVAGLTRQGEKDVWQIGGDLTWGDFTLAAIYEEDGPSDAAIGARYRTGPWTLTAGYGFTGVEEGDGENHLTAAWVSYALAPGVTASIGVEHHIDETDTKELGGSATLSLYF